MFGDGTDLGKAMNTVNKQKELNNQWNALKKDLIFSPGAFSYADSLTEQTVRATVGQGTIIVRNNPGMNLFGLNRDPSRALNQEVVRDVNFTVNPLFGYVDKAFSITSNIGEKYDFVKEPGKYIQKELGKLWNPDKNKLEVQGKKQTQNP